MPQGPVTGSPKGKVNLFDTIFKGAQTPGFDPADAAYRLGKDVRQGAFELVFDEEDVRTRYAQDPVYKDKPEDLERAIETARYMSEMVASDQFMQGYRPPPSAAGVRALQAPLGVTTTQRDPYTYYDLFGKSHPAGGSTQQLVTSMGKFYDRHGQLLPLTDKDLSSRRLYVSDDMVTDADGQLLHRPIARELGTNEAAYGKEMLSQYGAKPFTRSWMGSFLTDLHNGLGELVSPVVATMENSYGNNSRKRMVALYEAYHKLGAGPKYASTVDDLMERGVLYPQDMGITDVIPQFQLLQMAMNPSAMAKVNAEGIYDLIEQVRQQEPEYRARAKRGDQQAKIALDLLDLQEGIDGKSALARLGEMSYILQATEGIPTSQRRDEQGAYGGGEAIAGLLGQAISYIGPQRAAAQAMAKGILAYGGKELVTRSVAQGMRSSLSRLGGRTVAVGSSAVPTLQMTQGVYHSARDVGYSHDQAVDISWRALPIIMATEATLSGAWMVKSYMGGGGQAEMRRALAGALQDPSLAKSSSMQAMRAVSGTWNWLKKGSDNAIGNTFKNAAEGMAREGTQEGLEEFSVGLLEDWLDASTKQMRYAKSRPRDYSLTSRVVEAGVAGGIMGKFMGALAGGRRPVQPYDQGIAAMVAGGLGKDVLSVAQKMRTDGSITEEQLGVIQQDVALSQDIMASLNIEDPQVLDAVLKEKDLTTEFAQRSMQVKQLEAQLGEAQEAGEKQSIQAQIAQEKAAIQRITDGTAVIERLKDRIAAVSMVDSKGDRLNAQSTTAVATNFMEYRKERIVQHEQAQLIRGTTVAELNLAIDALIKAKPGDMVEAADQLLGHSSTLLKEKAFAKEDQRRVLDALKLKREEVMKELAKTEVPGSMMDGGGNFEQAVDDLVESGALTFEEAVDQIWGPKILQEKENEPARQLYLEWKELQAMEMAYGSNEQERARNEEGLTNEAGFDVPLDDSQVLYDYLSSLPLNGGQNIPVERYIEGSKRRTSATEKEIEDLSQALKVVDGHLLAQKQFAGDLLAMSRKFQEGKVAAIVGEQSTGVQQLKKEEKEVYEPASRISPEQLQKLVDLRGELAQEHMRLGKLLDLRQTQLARFQAADLAIQLKMLGLYVSYDQKATATEEFASSLAAASEALAGGDMDRASLLITRLRNMVSTAINGDVRTAKSFLKHMLDRYDWTGMDLDLNYKETMRLNQQAFWDYFDAGVLEGDRIPQNQANAAVAMMTNFVSELARTSVAESITAYHAALDQIGANGFAPNAEQQRRILEALSFLNNPSQDMTEALLSAKRNEKQQQKDIAVERFIAMPGKPGVGKTTVIPVVVSALAKLKARHIDVLVLAPGAGNLNQIAGKISRLGPDARVRTLSMAEMRKASPDQSIDLIVVDEAHVADEGVINDLRALMQRHPEAAGIALGDPMQSPSLAQRNSVFPLEQRMMRTLPLQVSFRHANIPMLSAIEELNRQVYPNLQSGAVMPELPVMKYVPGKNYGVRLSPEGRGRVQQLFADHLVEAMAGKASQDAMLIVLDNAQREQVLAELKNNTQLLALMDMSTIEPKVLTMDKGANSALGLEADVVFVAYGPEQLGASYTRFLYTSLSRGRHGAVVNFPGGRSEPVESVPEIESDSNAMRDGWRASRDKLRALSEDMATRMPTKEPKEPKPNDRPKDDGSPEPDEKDTTTANGTLFPEQPAGTVKTTRYSFLHKEETRYMPGSTATLPFNPDFPGDRAAIDLRNPYYMQRMHVMREALNSNAFTVNLVKVTKGSYNGPNGEWSGSAIEVHLNEDSLVMINRIRKSIGLDQLATYEDAVREKASMIGSFFMRTKAKDSSLAAEQAMLMRAFADTSWPEGGTIPIYTNLPIASLHPGLRGSEPGNEAKFSYQQLKDNLARKGFVASEPYMATAIGGKPAWFRKEADGTTTPMPAIVIEVSAWPGGPVTKIFLNGKPADPAYYTEMERQLDLAIEDADERPNQDRYKARGQMAFGFIQWNRSNLIKDGAFVDPKLSEFMELDQHGHPRMIHDQRNLKDWLTDMKKALDVIKSNPDVNKRMTMAIRVAKGAKTDNGMELINSDDFDRMVAAAGDVHMPVFTVDLSSTGKLTALPNTSGRVSIKRTKVRVENSASEKMRRTAIEDVNIYYRRVFGDRFLNDSLDFKNGLKDKDGRKLWGVMENARITLDRDEQGTVLEGVQRHEAVHYVLDHLLDHQSKMRVLNEAAELYAKRNGLRSWQVSDESANEEIAREYEKPSYDTSTVFGRFMRWLKGVMKRWGLYSSRIDDLLYAIERGDFRDAGIVNDQVITRFSRSHRVDEETRAQYSLQSYFPEDSGLVPSDEGTDDPGRIHRWNYRDRHILGRIFGDHVTANSIIHEIGTRLLNQSQYQAPTSTNLNIPLPSLGSAKANVFGPIRQQRVLIDPRLEMENGESVPFDELTEEQIRTLPDDRWDDYVTWKLGDDQVFNVVMQAVFPGLDIEKLALENQFDEELDITTDEQALERLSAMAHDTNQYLDPFKRQSGLTKLMLSTTRLIHPPAGKKPAHEAADSSGVDQQLLLSVVQRAAQGAMTSDDGRTPIQVFADRLLVMEKADPTSREGLHAGTIYRRFLDPNGNYMTPTGAKAYSYAYMVANAEQLIAKHGQNEHLQKRIEMARTILANPVRSFLEITGTNRIMEEWSQGEMDPNAPPGMADRMQGRMHHSMLGFDAVTDVKADINARTSAPFYASGTSGVSIDPDYRAQWSVGLPSDKGGFKIEPTGVSMPDGDVLVKAQGNGGFSLMTQAPEAIEEFFRAAGYELSARTIESMLAENEGAALARTIGYWAMAIHAGIHRVENGELDAQLFSNRALDRIKGSGVGTETSADIHGTSEEDATDSYPMPSMLFGINEELARIEARTRGTGYMQSLTGVSGKRIHPVNLGTALSTLLPAAVDGLYSSHAMEQHAEALIARDPALVSTDGRILNPLLDRKNAACISNVYQGMGMRDLHTGFARDPHRMSELDIESTALDLFATNLLANKNAERLMLTLHPNGDRDRLLVAKVEGILGGSDRVVSISDKSVTLNKQAVAKMMADQFDYNVRQQSLSMERWGKFLGQKFTKLSDLRAAIAGANKDRVMASPDLMVSRDYVIKGDEVKLGHAAEMDFSAIYSQENVRKFWAVRSDPSAWVGVMDEIYAPFIEAYRSKLFGAINEETGKREGGIGFRWQPAVTKKTTEAAREQLLDSYFYLTHFVDQWASVLVDGPAVNYKDAQDYIKRSVMAESPGHIGLIIRGGIGVKMKLAIIQEPIPGQKALDGQSYITPWGFQALRTSFGGDEGVIRNAVNKMVISQSDLKDKSSQLPITAQVYRSNPWLASLLRRSLSDPDLLKAWDAAIGESTANQFKAATDAVIQTHNAKLEAIEDGSEPIDVPADFLSSVSNIKMGARAINADGDAPLSTVDVDSRFLRVQTNLERSLTNRKAPYFTQLSALMGVAPHNKELVEQLSALEAQLTAKWIEEATKAVDEMPGEDQREKVHEWLRAIGLKKTGNDGQTGQVVDMLLDPSASVSNPILRRKLMEYVASEITSEAINPKMHGQMFTQASAYGFMVPEIVVETVEPTQEELNFHSVDRGSAEHKKNEELYSKAEDQWRMQQSEEAGDDPRPNRDQVAELQQSYAAEMEQAMAAWDQEFPAPSATTVERVVMRPLLPPRIEGGTYQPGEILMPFLYAKEFGFADGEWEEKTFQEIRTDVMKRMGEVGVNLFDRAMLVYAARTPSSGISSGQMMKVVGFINDVGNTMFWPHEANAFTGGDYDGDQMSVYLRNITTRKVTEGEGEDRKEFLIPEERIDLDTPEGIQSRILDVMQLFYGESANAEMITMSIGTDELQKALSMATEASPDLYQQDPNAMELFTPAHSMLARRMAYDGVVLIGIGAQFMKGYALLSRAHNLVVDNEQLLEATFADWKPKVNSSDGAFIMGNISQLLNGMLDNTKLMVIGQAGINAQNVGLIMGAVLDANPLPEAIKLAKHPVVALATQQLANQTSLVMGDRINKRPNLFQLLQTVGKEKDEEGNVVDPYEADRPMLLRFAYLGEAVSRVTRIFSLNTKGMPLTDTDVDGFNHDAATTMSASIDDMLQGNPATPDHYLEINQRQRDPALYAAQEQQVRKFFNARAAVESLSNIKQFVAVTDWANGMYQQSFIERHPFLQETFERVADSVGQNKHLRGTGRDLYNAELTGFLISLYMDQRYSGVSLGLATDREYNLWDRAGQYQFVMDFPMFWKAALSRIQRLSATDARRTAYDTNSFLSQVRVTGGHSMKVEMRNAQRLQQDTQLMEQIRRDATRVDSIFSGEGMLGDTSMTQMLSIYSMLKDRFGFGRHALTKFLPSSEMFGYNVFLENLHKGLSENGPEGVQYVLGNDENVTFKELMKRFEEAVVVVQPSLAPAGNNEYSYTDSYYWTTSKRIGHARILEVRNAQDPSVVLSSPSSLLAPRISVHGSNVLKDANVLKPDHATYKKLMAGDRNVVLESGSSLGWDANKPVHLPSGHVIKLLEYAADGKRAVLDASGVADMKALDDEPPALYKKAEYLDAEALFKRRGNFPAGYYGPRLRDLAGKSLTDACRLAAERSDSQRHRDLFRFFAEQQAVAERIAPIKVSGLRGQNLHGYISKDGITLGDHLTDLAAEQVLLHEIVHRYTAHTLNMPDEMLDAAGRAFKRKANALYREFLKIAPIELKEAVGDNVHEFVAECMSDYRMQAFIQQGKTARRNGKSMFGRIWHDLVNAVRRLIGAQVPDLNNDLVARTMDVTTMFIEDASLKNNTYNEERYDQWLVFHSKINDPSSQGVYPKRKPIEDIRDIGVRLLNRVDSEVTYEQMDIDRMVNHIVENKINWSVNKQSVNGIEFEIGGLDKAGVRDLLFTSIVPQMKLYTDRRKQDLATIFNSSNWKDMWDAVYKDINGEPMDSDRIKSFVAEQVDHQTGDIYVPYSQLNDPERILVRSEKGDVRVKDLGLQHVPAFEGFDPIVKVRMVGKKPCVTLIDVTRNRIGMRREIGVGKKLLSNYVAGYFDAMTRGLTTPNDEGGLRRFALGLTAMAMKQANPTISFRRMKVLSIGKGEPDHDSTWMHDFLHDVKAMKQTALYGELPTSIKAVLDDTKLYDADSYNMSWRHQYLDWLQQQSERDQTSGADRLSYNRVRTELERINTMGMVNDKAMADALGYRMRVLRDIRDDVEQDGEYKMIAQVYHELKSKGIKGYNSNRDTTLIGANLKNTQDVQSDYLQTEARTVEQSTMKIAHFMNGWRKTELYPKVDELTKVVSNAGVRIGGGDVVDMGWKRFERLWRMSAATESDPMERVYDQDADIRTRKLVQVRTNTIHWNEKDPYTARELREGRLSQGELAHGKWAAEQIHQRMIEGKMHNLEMDGVQFRDEDNGNFKYDEALEHAKAYVAEHYPMGWVPIVKKPFSESLSQGEVRRAMTGLWESNVNVDNLFNEDVDRDGNTTSYQLGNRYLSELEFEKSGSGIGGNVRLRRMGLRPSGLFGDLVIDSKVDNEAGTQNLEVILTYLTMAMTRQRIHEKESVPVVNSVISVLNSMEVEMSRKQTNNIKWGIQYASRTLYGANKAQEDSRLMVFNTDLTPMINLGISTTSFTGVALSWKVALQSGILNTLGSIGTAISSDLANDGIFGKKEIVAAFTAMADKGNRNKMAALLDYHFVTENQEIDQSSGFRRTKTRKLIFSGHALNIMNHWTDHNMRGVVMVAQMMKDGSWDAYSVDKEGNVSYDERKDRRWYNENGTLRPDGKVFIEGMRRKLIEDGVVGQEEDKPLKAGYDLQSGARFKWLTDKYVIGGMDRSQHAMIDQLWYGRMFTTFRKFLVTKVSNWYLRPTAIEKGGEYVIGVDPTTGEKAMVWEKREITSYVYALASTAMMLREASQMGWKEARDLSKAEKRAMARMSMDLVFFAVLYGLYAMMVPDDEERKRMRKAGAWNLRSRSALQNRFTSMFSDMAMDSFAAAPHALIGTFTAHGTSPVPAAGMATNLWNAIGDPSKFLDLVPGKTTIRDLNDLYQRSQEPEQP